MSSTAPGMESSQSNAIPSQILGDEDDFDETIFTQKQARGTPRPPLHPGTKKRKRKSRSTRTQTVFRSGVWDHYLVEKFPIFEKVDGMEVEVGSEHRAICKYCSTDIGCEHGTSVLNKHTQLHCKMYPGRVPQDPSKPESPSQKKLAKAFSQEACVQAACEMIVLDELPFSFIEKEGFKRFCDVACPYFDIPSRRSIVREFLVMYDRKRADLRNELQKHRVCLTTDTWTSVQNISYMVLTAHFIDSDWKMHKRVLNFCQIPNHKGTTIGKLLETCLVEWKIEKILTISVDNASANTVAIEWLKKKLNKWDKPPFVFDGNYLHVRCLAHILNLIVKSGLNMLDKSVAAIRNAVKYVRSSPARLACFKSCIQKEKLESRAMCVMDVPTRWNSTYLMLQSALGLKKAFERIADEEDSKFATYFNEYEEDEEEEHGTTTKNPRKRVGPPNESDWNKAAVFVQFLKAFYDVTLRTSASYHPTAQRALHDIIAIEAEINDLFVRPEMSTGSEVEKTLIDMAAKMRAKFQKYFDSLEDLNPLVLVALVLDPRYKLGNFIHLCQKRLGLTKDEAQDKANELKNFVIALTDLYASSSASASQKETIDTETVRLDAMDVDEEVSGKIAEMNDDWEKELEETAEIVVANEFEKYLVDGIHFSKGPIKPKFDILNWWRVNGDKYPKLAAVARDVLAIQVSTVASESCFSTGKRVIDPHRSSLTPRSVEALICLQNWIRSEDISILEFIPSREEMEFYEGVEKEHAENAPVSKPTRLAKSPKISKKKD